jgi:hypothetical protein
VVCSRSLLCKPFWLFCVESVSKAFALKWTAFALTRFSQVKLLFVVEI